MDWREWLEIIDESNPEWAYLIKMREEQRYQAFKARFIEETQVNSSGYIGQLEERDEDKN